MPSRSGHRAFAATLCAALHVVLGTIAGDPLRGRTVAPHAPQRPAPVLLMEILPSAARAPDPEPVALLRAPDPAPLPMPAVDVPTVTVAPAIVTDREPATMAAPAAPRAEEWALAARYTLKNSKRYRYNWGVQVRSMMGTAVEGPDQGVVRFRVEIAPDGTLARLETLWTTSAVAERLARAAIGQMPPLPPTPTGQPLVFDRTISFSPFASDGPPIYRDDCLPDPPAFRNPFAWDGRSPRVRADPVPAARPDPQALEDCLRQLPQDSIEGESAHDKRLMDQWGSSKSGG